jgi:sulfopyruvate decarboxylase TPP-binding subunit
MVKVKEFFKVLCEDLNYRFFSGVVCSGLSALYKSMSDSFMLYVPAVNETIALGVSAGAAISGMGSGIFLDLKFKEDIYSNFNFLIENKLPLIIIGYSENKKESFKYDIPIVHFKETEDIVKLSNKMEKKSVPGLLVIGKDVLK